MSFNRFPFNRFYPSCAGVYKITSRNTQFFYFGATKRLDRRIKEHYNALQSDKHPNKKLQELHNSGEEFSVFIIPLQDEKVAFLLEKHLIRKFKGHEKILNIRDSCPAPMSGRKMTDEQKLRIKESIIKRMKSGWISPLRGISLSQEVRRKISVSHKKLYENGYKNHFTGKSHSEENKERQRVLAKSQWTSPEFRKKVLSGLTDKLNDPEYKKIVSTRTKRMWQCPEKRSQILQKLHSYRERTNWKENLSIKGKARFSDPTVKEQFRLKMKTVMSDVSVKNKVMEGLRRYYNSDRFKRVEKLNKLTPEEVQVRTSEYMKKQWSDPEKRPLLLKRLSVHKEDPNYRHPSLKKTIVDGVEYSSVAEACLAIGMSKAHFWRTKGKRGSKVKKIRIDGEVYSSVKEAKAILGISNGTWHRKFRKKVEFLNGN